MKNLTVSVPEDVYRAARIRAAEAGSSVSSLVAAYLRSLTDQDAEFARLQSRQEEILAEVAGFSAGDRLDRDEVHRRAVR